MIDFNSFFSFSQSSFLYLAVGVLSVFRCFSAPILLFIVLGSFAHGAGAGVLLAGLTLFIRLQKDRSTWWTLKDYLSILCLVMGGNLESPYREFVMSFGILGISMFRSFGILGVLPALYLSKVYLGVPEGWPVFLGSAMVYAAFNELLRMSKKSKLFQRNWRRRLGVLLTPMILIPFYQYCLVWFDYPKVLATGMLAAVIAFFLMVWVLVTRPILLTMIQRVRDRAEFYFDQPSRWISGTQFWLTHQVKSEKTTLSSRLDSVFWLVLILVLGWFSLVWLSRGVML